MHPPDELPDGTGNGKAAEEADGGISPPDGELSLAELVAQFQRLIHFRRPEDAVLVLLCASQGFIGGGTLGPLPAKCVAYCCFVGTYSSGKSTATEAATQIAGGYYVTAGTAAAFRDILDGGKSQIRPRALGIDEVDRLEREIEGLEGMLRVGNRWDAPSVMREPEGRGHRTVTLNVGGPKFFNYRRDPEDALASRTLIIELEPCDDGGIITESLLNNPITERIKSALFRRWVRRSKEWDAVKLEAHLRSPEFQARAAEFRGVTGRGKQLGMVLLLVNDVMGFDADRVIGQYLAESREREDSVEPLREIVRGFLQQKAENGNEVRVGFRVANKDLLDAVNKSLSLSAQKSLTHREWSRAKRDLYLRTVRGVHGRYFVQVTSRSLESLALGQTSPSAATSQLESPVREENLLGEGPTKADRARASLGDSPETERAR